MKNMYLQMQIALSFLTGMMFVTALLLPSVVIISIAVIMAVMTYLCYRDISKSGGL